MAEPAVTEPTSGAAERDAARMTSSGGRESNSGRGSLDEWTVRMAVRRMVRTVVRWGRVVVMFLLHIEMVMLELAILGGSALSMNTERDELGTSDVANEVLGIVLIITELILGKIE